MWKTIDGRGIKILQDKFWNSIHTRYKYDEDVSYLVIGLLFCMGGAFFLILNGFDNLTASVLCSIFILAGIASITVHVILHQRWEKLKQLVSKNQAEYAEGILKGKFSELKYYESKEFGMVIKRGGLERNYFAKVTVNGRRVKIPCTKKVYKKLKRGDTVYIVDLIGKQAAYPQFCYAVADIENYIGLRYMNNDEKMTDLKRILRQLDDLKTFRFARTTGDIASAVKIPCYPEEKEKLALYARTLSDMIHSETYHEREDLIPAFISDDENIRLMYRDIAETETILYILLSE